MRYAEALAILTETARRSSLSEESVSLDQAMGRRAFRDHVAQLTIPPFHNSGVDGFSFRASETESASVDSPVQFSIAGTLFPGDLPPEATPRGAAWEIMTGAPFPKDCDSAVKVEDSHIVKNEKGEVTSLVMTAHQAPGSFVRKAGGDFRPGDRILSAGEKIRAEHLMALASNGVSQVSVFKKPRVVLVSTGSELAQIGDTLEPGQIYNSTQIYLSATLKSLGCEVEIMPVIKDDPQAFRGLIDKLKKNPPTLLLTTGAVSMGKADFVRETLESAGARTLFHRVDIRPGRPILFATFEDPNPFVVFGLPGNPVSSVVGIRFFIEAYLRALMNLELEKPIRASLTNPYTKPEALRCFLKAQHVVDHDRSTVHILDGQPSFMVQPLLKSSAWAIAPEGVSDLSAGTVLDLYPPTSEF